MNVFWRQSQNLSNINKIVTRHYWKGATVNLPAYKTLGKAGAVSVICTALYLVYNKHKGFSSQTTTHDGLLSSIYKDNTPRTQFNFINKVVEQCASAVVYVEIKDPRRIDKGTEGPTVVSNGSGFLIHEDGWILTNAHVVINKPQAEIEIKLHDGNVYRAIIEDADMNIDLALLKINANRKLPALSFAKSGDLSIGEWVVALGSPLSLSHSATAGVISCVNRHADELGLRNYQMRYIQTDAPITFGNSGGPLVNLDGDVIGINNLRITAGISFAIPIDYAMKFLEKIKYGTVHSRKPPEDETGLGITTITLTQDILRDALGTHKSQHPNLTHGVLVWKILPTSLLNAYGLKAGDIITHINGIATTNSSEVYRRLKGRTTQLNILVIRNGERINLKMDGL